MKIIGITGGVGAGKSQVLSYFEEAYGAVLCQADEVAKRLQRKGTKCWQEIAEQFGEEILESDGKINRKALAEVVFRDKAELAKLNAIVHPAVKQKVRERIQKEEKKGTGVFVLEAALLIEEHYDEICDEIWYIYADEETRQKRLMASRGYSAEKIQDMFAAQLSSRAFFDGCDKAIDNSQSFEETCQQIDRLMETDGIQKTEKQTGENR